MSRTTSTKEETLEQITENAFREIIQIATDVGENAQDWERIGDKSGVSIYKKQTEETKFCCLKGVGIIEAHPKVVFDFINDINRVKEWDRMFDETKLIKQINQNTRLIYVASKGKFPVSPRDFCVISANRIESDGTYIQVVRSVTNPEVPEIEGKVRAELLTSGFFIKPVIKHNGITKVISLVTYITQFDPKGWLPTLLANKLNEYQPLRISRIRTIIQDELNINQNEGKQEIHHDIDASTSKDMSVSPIPYSPVKYSPFKSPPWSSLPPSPPSSKESDGPHFFVAKPKKLAFKIEEEEEDDDEYSEAVTDFSNMGEDVSICLSTLQQEVTTLHSNVQRLQGQLNFMERKAQGRESNQFTKCLSRLEDLEEQLQEQEKAHRILAQLFNKRLALVSSSRTPSNNYSIQIANPRGKILLFALLVVWPWISFKIWQYLKKRSRGRILGLAVSMLGLLLSWKQHKSLLG